MIGAHFEISIDGKPGTYRDRKAMAEQAAAVLKESSKRAPCKAQPSVTANGHRASRSGIWNDLQWVGGATVGK